VIVSLIHSTELVFYTHAQFADTINNQRSTVTSAKLLVHKCDVMWQFIVAIGACELMRKEDGHLSPISSEKRLDKYGCRWTRSFLQMNGRPTKNHQAIAMTVLELNF
jgi:hypothetical protein